MLRGCDISMWQGNSFDFSDYDFIIIKATEGRTYTDPQFKSNIERAISTDKLYGAYHYARPDNGNTAKDEAKHFVEVIKPYIGKCVMALDWEDKAWNYDISWALTWLTTVYELTGVKPLIYASSSKLSLLKCIADADFGLWAANWTKQPSPYPFKVMAMWQYTNKPNDKDYFYGSKSQFLAYAKVANEEALDNKTEDEIEEIFDETSSSCGCELCKTLSEFVKNIVERSE